MKWWTSTETLSRLMNWVGVGAALLTCATAALKFRYDVLRRASDQRVSEARKIPEGVVETKAVQASEFPPRPKPKVKLDPLREKLRRFCDGIDVQVLTALASGNTRFRAHFFQDQMVTLREIAGEPGADQYIKFQFGEDTRLLEQGMTSEVLFELDPSLLVP